MLVAPCLKRVFLRQFLYGRGVEQKSGGTLQNTIFYCILGSHPEVRLVQHRLQLHWFGSSFAIVADACHGNLLGMRAV